jgi:hypothetical protein
MITEQDRELAIYIQSIFKSDFLAALCWGYSQPRIIKNGLEFNVSGLKHQGKVRVIYNEGMDLFEIQLLTETNDLKESIEGIYFDELVEVIDNHIERVESYTEVVRGMYGMVKPELDK